ncbi:zinc finger protein 862-like isoform X1 [Tachysurus ichikawai]
MPHRLELAMLDVQKSVPMIEKVYDLLQLVWKTYHFSPKSKHELKAIGLELGCAIRTPSAVKTQRWLPHMYRALSVFLASDVTTGQGQYTAVHLHMQHLAASSKNIEIRGRAKHISQQMEKLPFVVFCHFLHDPFGEISKLSLILQKNSVILPQAIAAI